MKFKFPISYNFNHRLVFISFNNDCAPNFVAKLLGISMLVKVAFVIKSTMLAQVVERGRLHNNEPRSSPAYSSGRKC